MRSRRATLVLSALLAVTAVPTAAAAVEFVDGPDDVCITERTQVIDRTACDTPDRHADLAEVEVTLRADGALTVDASTRGVDVETLAVVLLADGVPAYALQGDVGAGALLSTRVVAGVPQPLGCTGSVALGTVGAGGFLFLDVDGGCLDVDLAQAWSVTVSVQRVVDDEVRTDFAPDVGALPLDVTPLPPGFVPAEPPVDDDGGPDESGVLRARDVASSCADVDAAFDDVPAGAGGAHSLEINCLANLGLVSGFGDGTFRPSAPVTVGQLAIMLDGVLAEGGTLFGQFTGCGGGPASTQLAVLSEAGILPGCDGAVVATRSDLAVFVARALRAAGVATPAPTDWFDDDGAPASAEHDALAELGVTVGTGDRTFSPDEPLTRAKAATFLARMLDVLLDA